MTITPKESLKFLCILLLHVNGCMSMHHMCIVLSEAKGGINPPVTEVTDGCKQPGICWESNQGPVQKQPVLLTLKAPPQPHLK